MIQQGLHIRPLPAECDPVMRRLMARPMTVKELHDELDLQWAEAEGPAIEDFVEDRLVELISSAHPLADWGQVRLIARGSSDGALGEMFWKLRNDDGKTAAVSAPVFWTWTLAHLAVSLEAAVDLAATYLGTDMEDVRSAVELELPVLLSLGLIRFDIAPTIHIAKHGASNTLPAETGTMPDDFGNFSD